MIIDLHKIGVDAVGSSVILNRWSALQSNIRSTMLSSWKQVRGLRCIWTNVGSTRKQQCWTSGHWSRRKAFWARSIHLRCRAWTTWQRCWRAWASMKRRKRYIDKHWSWWNPNWARLQGRWRSEEGQGASRLKFSRALTVSKALDWFRCQENVDLSARRPRSFDVKEISRVSLKQQFVRAASCERLNVCERMEQAKSRTESVMSFNTASCDRSEKLRRHSFNVHLLTPSSPSSFPPTPTR